MKPLELPGLVTQGDESAWAMTSLDNVYRYALGRCWAPTLPVFDVTMINPSTARHDVPDPTMSKVVHFAKQEGCGSVLIRNLAAFSAVDPDGLRQMHADQLLGPHNLEVLGIEVPFGVRLAAWGNFPSPHMRSRLIRPMGIVKKRSGLHVLGFNKSREPKHPLYLKNSTRVVLWADAIRGQVTT